MPLTPAQEMQLFGDWRSTSLPQWLGLRKFCVQADIGYSTAREMIRTGRLRAVTCDDGHSYKIPIGELTRVFTPVAPKAGA